VLLASPETSGAGESTPLLADTTADSGAAKALGSDPFLGVSATRTTYVRFDLSMIPPGSSVHSATLSLFLGRMLAGGSVSVYRVTSAWDEDTLVATRTPGVLDAALPETLAVSDATPFVEYLPLDVTAAVSAWLGGAANHGLALRGSDGVDVEFISKENQAVRRPMTLEVVLATPQP
jgi:hypothetical protein